MKKIHSARIDLTFDDGSRQVLSWHDDVIQTEAEVRWDVGLPNVRTGHVHVELSRYPHGYMSFPAGHLEEVKRPSYRQDRCIDPDYCRGQCRGSCFLQVIEGD